MSLLLHVAESALTIKDNIEKILNAYVKVNEAFNKIPEDKRDEYFSNIDKKLRYELACVSDGDFIKVVYNFARIGGKAELVRSIVENSIAYLNKNLKTDDITNSIESSKFIGVIDKVATDFEEAVSKAFSSETSEDKKETSENNEEHRKIIAESFGTWIAGYVDGYMATLTDLYASCYDVSAPGGLLVKGGLIKARSDGSIVLNGDRISTNILYNKVVELIGPKHGLDKFLEGADGKAETDININKLESLDGPVCMYGLHLQIMYGYYRLCPGLQSWVNKNNITKGVNTDKVLSWDVMKRWVREKITNSIYDAFYDRGLHELSDLDQAQRRGEAILGLVERNIKNVIVACDYKLGTNTELRISSYGNIQDFDSIAPRLASKLNSNNNSTILVNQIGKYQNGILDLNIIYNNKRYSENIMYAHEVLDSIFNQGIEPSWSRVILGKGLDGKTFTYNFKQSLKPVICLYAGSRSGKGVMTLNLLASALADGCKVFYTDGKPDSSKCLAEIAWKAGKETCVFNGLTVDPPLEDMPVAPESRKSAKYRLPDLQEAAYIFGCAPEKDSKASQFLDLIQCYKGFEVVAEAARERSSQGVASKDRNDWVVAIFDELQNTHEKLEKMLIPELLANYKEFKKTVEAEKKKKNGSPDPEMEHAVEVIENFQKWQKSILGLWNTGKTITFGKANISIIFIWQDSNFPPGGDKQPTGTLLDKIVFSFSPSTKILGRVAKVQGGTKAFGSGSAKSLDWYDTKFEESPGGYFAILEGNVDDSNGKAKVFKPYNVYGDCNLRLILSKAEENGIPKEQLIGSALTPDGQVIPEVGFENYAKKFLGHFGLDTATQLEKAFVYFNDFVKTTTHQATDLINYMYSMSLGLRDYSDLGPAPSLDPMGDGDGVRAASMPNIGSSESPYAEANKQAMSAFSGSTETGNTQNSSSNILNSMFGNATEEPEDTPNKNGEEKDTAKDAAKDSSFMDNIFGNANVVPDGEERDITSILEERQKEFDKPVEKDEVEEYAELLEKQKEALQYEQTVGEASKVGVSKSRNQEEFSGNNAGNVEFDRTSRENIRNSEKMTFKNSLYTTFSLGKKSLSYKIAGMRGIDLESKEMFRELISHLKWSGLSFGNVSTVAIDDNRLLLNNRNVNIGNYVHYDRDFYEFVDIVDFDILFNSFKNINTLVVSRKAFMRMQTTMSKKRVNVPYSEVCKMVFNRNKSLMQLVYYDYRGKEVQIYRDQLENAEVEAQINSSKEKDVTAAKLSAGGFSRRNVSALGKAAQSKASSAAGFLKSTGQSVPRKVAGIGKTGLAIYGLGVIAWPLGAAYALYSAGKMLNNYGKSGMKAQNT